MAEADGTTRDWDGIRAGPWDEPIMEAPSSPEEAKERGFNVDLALGGTFRSRLEPSGPMSSYTEEGKSPEEAVRAGRFAKLAVRSAADGVPEDDAPPTLDGSEEHSS
jgi:hypothetical protein